MSHKKKAVYDSIRSHWVAASPEEYIRQAWVQRMYSELGYPKDYLAIEKKLSSLNHLTSKDNCPDRRLDILCFAKNIHTSYSLFPLILVECKAHKLNDSSLRQVVGYNHYVHAPFIALVNDTAVRTGWFDKNEKKYRFVEYMPIFEDLINSIQIREVIVEDCTDADDPRVTVAYRRGAERNEKRVNC